MAAAGIVVVLIALSFFLRPRGVSFSGSDWMPWVLFRQPFQVPGHAVPQGPASRKASSDRAGRTMAPPTATREAQRVFASCT